MVPGAAPACPDLRPAAATIAAARRADYTRNLASPGDLYSMARILSATMDAASHRFAIVVSRFNELVTGRLLDAALDTLARHGVAPDHVSVAWTPGAWELPVVAQRFAAGGRVTAIIALGCVVRGDTPHFDYVAGESARGLQQVAVTSGVPVLNGVLTTNSMEQALDRAGGKAGNKGAEAAAAAIEMANLVGRIHE